MQPADNVHLGYVLFFFFDLTEYFVEAHHVCSILPFLAIEGTELAIELADVCIIENVISDEVRVRAIDRFPHHVSKMAQGEQIIRVVKSQPIFAIEPLPDLHFLVNALKFTEHARLLHELRTDCR